MIRDLAAEDLVQLAFLWQAAFAEPVNQRGILRLWGSEKHKTMVYVANGAVQGFVALLIAKDPKKFNIDFLARDPCYPEKGVGQALMREAEATARVRGATHMRLSVRRENKRAIRFYNLQGYRPVKETKLGFTMQKALT